MGEHQTETGIILLTIVGEIEMLLLVVGPQKPFTALRFGRTIQRMSAPSNSQSKNPPAGSKIRVESERGLTRIVVPHGSGGLMRYGIALFLLAWLGGWAVGWLFAASS